MRFQRRSSLSRTSAASPRLSEVIDEEVRILDMRERILGDSGDTVLCTRSGVEEGGINFEWREHRDLVVLDIRIPKMSGNEVKKRFKEIAPDVRVFLIHGYSELEERTNIMSLGIRAMNRQALSHCRNTGENQINTGQDRTAR